MLPSLIVPMAVLPSPLALATHAFLAGTLVALALLASLAYRPLRDQALSQAGLFGLVISAAWMGVSSIAPTLLPASLLGYVHPASLILAGLSLVIWERVTSTMLASSPGARRLAHIRRGTALTTLCIALAAILPWRLAHTLAELLLGLLAPFLALLTLSAGLRARREGLRTAGALITATVAILVCCAALWTLSVGRMTALVSLSLLQFALVVLAMALGWALLSRMTELRLATEEAQNAQLIAAAHQAHDLEALVEQRNAELSARLRDLNEARRTAETANQALQRALDQLEEVAATDRLTGAWNRRRFEEAVLPEIALAHRRREPLSLLMFDLDHFKRVNDDHGHGAGDAVLAGTAQTVRLHLRASDSLVRWGGEEFLVMAPATRLEGAMGLAEKLRAAVAAIHYPEVGSVTMSLGVSEYALGESLVEWIERTDQALYTAKSEGRNRCCAAAAPERNGIEPASDRSLLEVIWEETYESGHALIDRQHQRLFRLASALMAVLTENRPLPEVALRLETLLAHTAQHFHDEEALLREARYSDLPEHAAIHAALMSRARKLQAEVQAGHLDFGRLVAFLALDLVKGHILSEDRNYFGHLRRMASPEGMPPAGA
ncbi:diguanylate cyclase [Geothrix sp. PMB-07]|uniref:diguanylate cyclase n=1 Tax=Geothrix sp. PMB-07 TaxID=3068640 RepID=UPI0027409664|nr:diguanylate cyclase [Geothrix sp. PMB-07]WLT30409.1 diguanylate cyclase [Geothrix sp. PMB-07]